jgi:hypothetical protein
VSDAPPLAKLLVIGAAAASLLALLVALISLLLILDLRGDAAVLVEQSRKTAKAVKALREEVADMKTALQPPANLEPAVGKAVEVGPVHIDAVDRKRDCVLRTGDPKSLVDCINTGPAR